MKVALELLKEATRRWFPVSPRRHSITFHYEGGVSGSIALNLVVGDAWPQFVLDDDDLGRAPTALLDDVARLMPGAS